VEKKGLMENTGSLSEYEYSSLKQEVEILYVQIAMKINAASRRETRYLIKKAN